MRKDTQRAPNWNKKPGETNTTTMPDLFLAGKKIEIETETETETEKTNQNN